jgi:hypothetical protein
MTDSADPHAAREPVHVLVLSASMREDSLNSRLAGLTARCFEGNDVIVECRSMADFAMPLFDQDDEDATGFPSGAEKLRTMLDQHDAFVIVSPEYNASMPGSLKNAIDWLSRFRPQPFNERQCMLLSASVATEAYGPCGFHSNISVPASIRTCSRYRKQPAPSTSAANYTMLTSTPGCIRPLLPSWILSRPQNTIPASKVRGWSSLARSQTLPSTASTRRGELSGR